MTTSEKRPRHTKRHVVLTAIAALTLLGVSAVWAARQGPSEGQWSGRTKRTLALWRTGPVSTSSSTFENVPGLSGAVVKNRGVFTITLSASLSGAPVELRVAGAKPQVIEVDPGGPGQTSGSETVAFTFVDRAAREGTCSGIDVEWRSLDGEEATLESGTVAVEYRYVGDERAKRLGCV